MIGDIMKFKPCNTTGSNKLIWYGLVTEENHDSSKVKWFDPTHWMKMNQWVHNSRLEKMNAKR